MHPTDIYTCTCDSGVVRLLSIRDNSFYREKRNWEILPPLNKASVCVCVCVCVCRWNVRFLAVQAPDFDGAVLGPCHYQRVHGVEGERRHHIKMTVEGKNREGKSKHMHTWTHIHTHTHTHTHTRAHKHTHTHHHTHVWDYMYTYPLMEYLTSHFLVL